MRTSAPLLRGRWAAAALLATALAACGPSGPSFVQPPSITANSNAAVPLAAVVTFEADRPVSTTLRVSDGENSWELHYSEDRDPAKGLPVLGMRPVKKHEIQVAIRGADGQESQSPKLLEFTTPALPADAHEFPPLNVTAAKPDQMEPGITIFNPRRRRPGRSPEIQQFNQSYGLLLAVDAAGEVLWYYRTDSRISDFDFLRNGNLIIMTQDFRLVEFDWLGNTVNQWYAKGRPEGPMDGIAVDTLTFHHEVDELPNGNLVVLGSEIREVDDFFTSETNRNAPRKRQPVMGDHVIEFERETGKIVWEWKAFDHMDPLRIGYETFSGYWERRGFAGVIDWSHANNLLYDENNDSLLVNFRLQSAILKLDRKTREIRWILGEPSGWGALEDKVLRPLGEFRWPYHNHAPHPTPHGTLLVFDNGNYQARPFEPATPPRETFSRAVEYEVDEENMTVRQVWVSEKKNPDRVVSIAMGDVDWLPETGNVLVGYGALLAKDSLETLEWDNRSGLQWTQVREYKRTTPAELVWEIVVESGQIGWTLFGVERIPGFTR